MWTKEYRSSYHKNYNFVNREKIAAHRKKWSLDNKRKIRVQDKEYYIANIEKITAYRKLNGQKSRDYCKAYAKLNSERLGLYKKEYRQNLSDGYVRHLLAIQCRRYSGNAENITQELINLKRGQLLLSREIGCLKKEVQNGTN